MNIKKYLKNKVNKHVIMSKFLKLTKFLLNTSDIHKIVINPNKYDIHVVTRQITGNSWNISAFGLGNIYSNNYEIEICKTNDPTDYKIITDWIDAQ